MRKVILIAGVIWLMNLQLHAQQSHLSKRITLNLGTVPVSEALLAVAKAGNFTFSFNTDIINTTKKVKVWVKDEKVETILQGILGWDIRYKEVGNHVILMKKNPEKRSSGIGIEKRVLVTSSKEGKNSLPLPADSIRQSDILLPLKSRNALIPIIDSDSMRPDTLLMAGILPKTEKNPALLGTRGFQVSLVPYIGTNWSNSSSITNAFSFNMIAGYARGVKSFELGALANIDRDRVSGLQIAGFLNIAGGSMTGVQIGVLNYSGKVKGVQLGLINISGTVEGGVPIGFFSYTGQGGYRRFEFSIDEVFWANFSFRTGTPQFYNILKVGIGETSMLNFTWGAGTLFTISKIFSMNLDLTIGVVTSTTSGLKYHGLIGKLTPTLDFRLAKHLSIFFGPSANIYWFNTGNSIMTDGIAPYTLYDITFTTGPHRIQLWVGGILGLRI